MKSTTLCLGAIAALMCISKAPAGTIAGWDFDDNTAGLESVAPDGVFGTTTVSDWTPSDNDPDPVGVNETGGLSGSGDNFFVRSSDGTINSTNPTTSLTFSSFVVTIDGLPVGKALSITNVSFDHFATGNSGGGANLFARLYTDLTGLAGTADGIANSTQFANNTGNVVDEDLSDEPELQGLTNGETVEFRLYYGDNANSNGVIHRVDNFVLEGVIVPEPNAVMLLTLALGAGAALSRSQRDS